MECQLFFVRGTILYLGCIKPHSPTICFPSGNVGFPRMLWIWDMTYCYLLLYIIHGGTGFVSLVFSLLWESQSWGMGSLPPQQITIPGVRSVLSKLPRQPWELGALFMVSSPHSVNSLWFSPSTTEARTGTGYPVRAELPHQNRWLAQNTTSPWWRRDWRGIAMFLSFPVLMAGKGWWMSFYSQSLTGPSNKAIGHYCRNSCSQIISETIMSSAFIILLCMDKFYLTPI